MIGPNLSAWAIKSRSLTLYFMIIAVVVIAIGGIAMLAFASTICC